MGIAALLIRQDQSLPLMRNRLWPQQLPAEEVLRMFPQGKGCLYHSARKAAISNSTPIPSKVKLTPSNSRPTAVGGVPSAKTTRNSARSSHTYKIPKTKSTPSSTLRNMPVRITARPNAATTSKSMSFSSAKKSVLPPGISKNSNLDTPSKCRVGTVNCDHGVIVIIEYYS